MIDISRAQKIYGQMEDEELTWLAETAARSKFIVELGCFHGRSTRALADNTQGIVYAVDDWSWQEVNPNNSYLEFQKNLRDHLQSGRVIRVPIRHEWAEGFYYGKKFDFIFIDGDHDYEGIHRDITLALPYVSPGGVLSGHDYCQERFPGVVQAVTELLPQARKVTETELAIWAATL